MNFRLAYGMVGIGFALLICGVWYFSSPQTEVTQQNIQTTTIEIGGQKVVAEIADTEQKQMKGLSGRASLPDGTGMFFVFKTPNNEAFWMPDMHFSIDIIWLDASMKVIYIKEDATPESYPDMFAPPSPALYVLEVPTGFSKKYNITAGVTAHIVQ